jgi:hypothetical protein
VRAAVAHPPAVGLVFRVVRWLVGSHKAGPPAQTRVGITPANG